MAKIVGSLKSIGENIGQFAGEEVRVKVMEGSEALKDSTNPEKAALWVKEAMERLDAAVDEQTRNQLMMSCGANCATINNRVVKAGVARREKYGSMEAFLEAELERPQSGTRLERDGDLLYQIYTPRKFSHPMRCYCSLMKGLPEGETASATYCQCSRGFVKTFWEAVLGRPVEVNVLETAISGAEECRFMIRL